MQLGTTGLSFDHDSINLGGHQGVEPTGDSATDWIRHRRCGSLGPGQTGDPLIPPQPIAVAWLRMIQHLATITEMQATLTGNTLFLIAKAKNGADRNRRPL